MNIPEVLARNEAARGIVAGFASAIPTLAVAWRTVGDALADCAALAAQLADTRMDRANLLAAMRATIAAEADGEADPLYYLRDELDARQARCESHGGAS